MFPLKTYNTAYRLEAGIQVDNLAAAESLVREYESEAAAHANDTTGTSAPEQSEATA